MSTSESDHAKGLLLTGIGGLALTFDIPLIKLASGDTWSVLMMRTGTTFIVAMIVWTVWRMVSDTAPRLVPGRAGIIVAALYGVSSIAFVTAIYNTTTANLAFIVAFNTMFAALLSWIFLKEKPRPATMMAMAVMVTGILIIVWDSLGAGHLLGDALALLVAFALACAITVSRASGKDMGFTSLVGVIFPCAVAMIMVGKTGFRVDAPWWIILNGAIVMPLSFYCLAAGPRYISGPEVAMFYLLETVLAPVWVWMIFAETPSRNSLIGGFILIAALVAHSVWQLLDGRRRRAARLLHHPA